MIISVLPVSAFATEEVAAPTEVSTETTEIPENYGTEVTVGSNIYYIEDGDLLYSSNNGRPKTINNDVTWIIEEVGEIFYSKLEGNNTYIYKVGEDAEIVKTFCPVECFDIFDNEVYCSYNGEIFKINIDTKEEMFVTAFNGAGFYMNEDSICELHDEFIEVSTSVTNNIELLSAFDVVTYQKQFCEVDINNTDHISGLCNVATLINLFRRKAAHVGCNANFTIESYFESLDANYKSFISCISDTERVAYWKSKSSVPGNGKTFTDAKNTFRCVVKHQRGITSDKLKALLNEHPEGVSIRYQYASGNGGHAILVTGYSGNQFYAIDPVYADKREREIEEAWKYPGLSYVGDVFTVTSYEAMGCNNCKKPNKTKFETSGDKFGVCKTCENVYDFTPSLNKSVSGYYTLKPSKSKTKITLRALPYDGSTVLGKGVSGSLEISGCIINAYNNKWYIVEYGDYVDGIWKEQSAFVYGPSIDDNYTKQYSVVYNDVEKKLAAAVNTTPKTVSTGGSVNTNTSTKTDKNVYINLTNYPTDGFVPKSFPLKGTITSDYPIYYLTAILTNLDTNVELIHWDGSCNTKKYTIEGSQLDRAVKFNNIRYSGNYRLRVIATNSIGESKYVDKDFYVNGENNTVEKPTISASTIEQGQKITVSCSDGNGLIHYTINGGSEKTGYGSLTQEFKTAGTYNVVAWTTKSGCNNSATINKTVSVSRVTTPRIENPKYNDENVTVTISGNGTLYYTTNGSTPSAKSTKYTGPIKLKDTATIRVIAIQYGYENSNVAQKEITVTTPDAPKITLNTEKKVAQGKTATISWQRVDRATGYTAYLLKDGEIVNEFKTTGTTASFALTEKNDTENIEYSIKVVATNFKGNSNDSNIVSVTAMHPVEVTFIDRILREGNVTDDVVEQIQQNVNEHYGDEAKAIEGNIISVQKIDYNSKPSIPTWDDKEGLSRQYFSDEAYQKITEDTIAYAYYSVKSYSVQFWNYWRDYSDSNAQIGHTQNIMYSFSAEPPTDVEAPTGYILAGWSVDGKVSDCYDFTFVEGDMKLDTVYTWENEELPVILEMLSAKRGNTCQSYDINLKYVHYNESDTQARIIVTLYTADNKVVNVSTEDVDLMAKDAGFDYTDTITVNYPDQVSRISAVMVQVKDDMTGGAVSEMVSTTDIEMPTADTYWGKWSDWSTTEPSSTPGYNENDFQGVERAIESKTQYSYRNKSYTSSSSSSLSGWTKYNTRRTGWSGTYGPVYSNPSNGSRNVWSESYVTSSNYKTVYRYYRYANSTCAYYGSSYPDYKYYYEWEFDYPLELKAGQSYSYKLWCGCGISGGYHTVYSVNWQGHGDYPASKWVSYNYGTRWYYQEPIYTYDYWKWGSWSSWSDTKVSGDDNKTRKVYRYRDKFNCYDGYDPSRDSQLEEETKQTYTMSGNILGLEKDYNGKLATVLVYKKTNTDPTQEQLEYVDQITLGENNSYSFVINPKDEIDYNKTGDYIVTLSIEGCDKLANIDIIKAPAPQQIVTFQNDDGTVLKDSDGNDVIVSIDKGGSIDVNNIPIPQKDGYRFLRWDKSLININADMTVAPIYTKNTYNVVFVDYENETTQMIELSYGDYFDLPEIEPITGKTFVGWDVDHYKYVSDGDVDTEIYNIKEEIPYYKTTDGTYILSTLYDENIHNIIDTTEYFKYISEEKSVITESRIITASWENIKCTVNFCDLDGKIVDTQLVEYGDTAIPPEYIEKDGITYSWDVSNDEWWNVTCDMYIYPYIPQECAVSAPTIDVSTEDAYGEFVAELESDVQNGKIYYSTDAIITEEYAREFAELITTNEKAESSDEQIELFADDGVVETSESEAFDVTNYITEYTEPLELHAGSVVYAFSIDGLGNISPISVFQYESDSNEEDTGDISNEYVPSDDVAQITMPTIIGNPGESVTIPVTIKNNPGLTNLEIILGYDTEDLTLEKIENGEIFKDEDFSDDTREDGSCKFIWETTEPSTEDGILMTLTFTLNETATEEKYLLDLGVEYSSNADDETYLVTVPGAITEDTRIIGDVNGDGEVDFADGIRILKHDVGLIDLTGDALITGDVNGDGEVDFADAILVLKFDVGLISSFKK